MSKRNKLLRRKKIRESLEHLRELIAEYEFRQEVDELRDFLRRLKH